MKPLRAFAFAVFSALLMTVGAADYNFNVDWKFTKLGTEHIGLKACLAANEQNGRRVYAVDYDDSHWEPVSVPHAINAHDSYDGHAVDAGEGGLYRGWMAYRKHFVAPKGKHFFLEFENVRNSVYLYVNGQFAGYYELGTCASGYDITPFTRVGEDNLVCVVSENTAGRGTKIVMAESKDEPGDWKGEGFQWNGTDFNPDQGGLVGNVILHVKANDNYITLPLLESLKTKGVYIWADDFDLTKGAATLHVEAEVVGKGEIEIGFGTSTGVRITKKAAGVWRAEGLKFWSPDTPFLYDINVQLVDGSVQDEVVIRTGFRQVAYDREKGLTLNGKPFWLPGYAQRSNNSWAAIGIPPDWVNDFDMELVRESKANFIRWMHVSVKPGPSRACDKAGVIQVCPAGDKEGDATGQKWNQRVRAMRAAIVYFRNSPSILFWEAGNNQITPEHMREMRLLKEELDPKGGRFMGCRTISSVEQLKEAEYVGTMIFRHGSKAYESMQKLDKFMPIIETEYVRAESARRLWDRYTGPDYDFVCKRLASGAKATGYNCYDMTQEDFALDSADCSGGYGYFYGNRASGSALKEYTACAALCWTDCNQHGRNSNTENCRSSGRVDAVRIPKENFYVHQTMYSQTPQVKVIGHWNYEKKTADNYWYREAVNDGKEITKTGERRQRDPEHKTVYVIGSVSVDKVELFVNGKSKGVCGKPNGLFVFPFENIDVTASGYVEAVGYGKDGKAVCRDRVETVGEAAKLEMTVTTGPKGFLADGGDIAIIDLRLVDAKGRVLPLANDRVNFKMEFSPAPLAPQTAAKPHFMGGWNSGTFDETSPIGKDWVNLELGVNRVFIKAGRTPGKVKLTALLVGRDVPSPRVEASVTLDQLPITVEGGLMAEKPQERPINVRTYTVKSVEAVRDFTGSAAAVRYEVRVNGKTVDFGRRGKPFKPDASTGVCCAYVPVLEALTNAGVKVEFLYNPKKIDKKKLRQFSATPYVASLTVKTGEKEIDTFAGVTVLFENNGEDKNLTNYEMVSDKGVLIGELAPLLGYLPGIKVETDTSRHIVIITTEQSIDEMEKGGELKPDDKRVEAPKDMKLILCLGQSNMAGRARMTDEDKTPNPSVFKLNAEGQWAQGCAPYHFDRTSAAVGPVDEFVKLYLKEHPGETVGVVPCAIGGSPMRDWTAGRCGKNLQRALERARIAQANGTFLVVLWHQGETDADKRSAERIAATYPEEFAGMIAKIRAEIGDVPVVLGEIGRWPRKNGADHAAKINPVLNAIPSKVSKSATVSSEGLRNQDAHHFDREGQRVLGTRYFEAFKELSR